jgi:hypothetical protein
VVTDIAAHCPATASALATDGWMKFWLIEWRSSLCKGRSGTLLGRQEIQALNDRMTSNDLRGFSCSGQLCRCPAWIQFLKQDNQCGAEE